MDKTTHFLDSILTREQRLAVLIGVNAGLQITGGSLRQAVTDATAQTDAALAIHERYQTDVLLTAMDLSAEAEAFGCPVVFSEDENPSIRSGVVTSPEQAARLDMPEVGSHRTSVHLEVAKNLVAANLGPVFGGCIGPFSLAALLMGVNDALKATITDPALVVSLLESATAFLQDYMLAFREVGATGVIMAEPTAGLLSPNALGKFSAPFVKRLVEAAQTEDFTLIYHNCGARNLHLTKILEADASVYHFGKLMNMASALQSAPSSVVLGGNIDPVAVFRYGTPEDVVEKASELLRFVKPYKNFFISSGCDLPSGVPVENLDAFCETVRDFR